MSSTSARPLLLNHREVRELHVADAVKLQELAADVVADALRLFAGVVLDFDFEEKVGEAHVEKLSAFQRSTCGVRARAELKA